MHRSASIRSFQPAVRATHSSQRSPRHFSIVILLTAMAVFLSAASVSYASETPRQGFFKKMSDPPLPPELTEDVDVFPMAKVRTMRNPLTFKPYRVAKLKRGWTKSRSGVDAVAVGRRSVAGIGTMSSRESYSFTVQEGDAPQWFVGCKWDAAKESLVYSGRTTSLESPTSAAVHLQCEIGRPGDTPLWGLLMDASHDARRGLAGSTKGEGELVGPESRYSIGLLYVVEGSRILGDLPGGFLFFHGERPIAAMQMAGGDVPVRFTISRSVPEEERSVIAAAAAALVLQQEMPDFD
jgi:hypothetical protein